MQNTPFSAVILSRTK